MTTKPADFFIGVVDLFSIFLPGALLAYLFLDAAQTHIFNGTLLPEIEGAAARWIAFVLAAYLLGHFASLMGALILDPIYEAQYLPHKKQGDERREKAGDKPRDKDYLYRYVQGLQTKLLGSDANIANPYKWARANVRLRSAAGTREIDRLEADSKFFRSVTVVLAAFIVASVFSKPVEWWIPCVLAVCMFGSFLRFADLRWKSNEASYLCLVVLEARGKR